MKPERARLNVLITIDTELWPVADHDFNQSFLNYICGRTATGDYGLRFQLDVFEQHGLKAIFFVEPLFAELAGKDMLREVVNTIVTHRSPQDVQLHLHPEWLSKMSNPIVPPCGRNFRDLEGESKIALLQYGVGALDEAGTARVIGFRAGNFGASRGCLHAVNEVGLKFDSSFNPDYWVPETGFVRQMYQPEQYDGVWEFPVSAFYDRPSHLRPAQVCACSGAEMRAALRSAWSAGWQSFVIVFHSFELLGNVHTARPFANQRIIKRFVGLCEFLAAHRHLFRTCHMRDITHIEQVAAPPIRSRISLTLTRYLEQAASRLEGKFR